MSASTNEPTPRGKPARAKPSATLSLAYRQVTVTDPETGESLTYEEVIPPEPEPEPRERTSWYPVDLTDALEGHDIPAPAILTRTDGRALLYAGRIHAFIGESESCKTWAALLAAVEVLAAGGMVLWIDFEDDERGLVARLYALGIAREVIREQVHYVHPEEPLTSRDGRATAGSVDLGLLLEEHAYALAVIDGVTEGMVTEGLDPLGTEDAAVFARRLAKRLASSPSSPAVVSLDHVPKSSEARGRFALGSQHKIAGLTGAAYIFEARRALSRATTEPVEAEIVVKVSKDRPGHVRAFGVGSDQLRPVAVLELTAYPDGGISGRLVPPDEAKGTPPADLLERIAAYLNIYPGSSGAKVREGVEGKAATLAAALRWMVAEGYADVAKVGQSHQHTLTDKGRDLL